MANSTTFPLLLLLLLLLLVASASAESEAVLTLAGHWQLHGCGRVARLHRRPVLRSMYEVAAAALRSHDPPIVLAKVDASAGRNSALAADHGVDGSYPTIRILRARGATWQAYSGPRVASSSTSRGRPSRPPSRSPPRARRIIPSATTAWSS
uniref:Uncharacterized protein n=1 Tax=Leersia perrieri TaxID=77586 RepID=A0A0D9VH16_9ORYZ